MTTTFQDPWPAWVALVSLRRAALNRRIGRADLYREHFGDGSDADARERVGALFRLSAPAAEEQDPGPTQGCGSRLAWLKREKKE